MMTARGLISFDAAGTLIQVARPVAQTYAEFARDHGVIVNESALKAAFRSAWSKLPPPLFPEGQSSDDDDRSWWRNLVEQVFTMAFGSSLPPDVLSPLFSSLYQHYAKPEAWTVYDDVFPALDRLASKFDLCVLSNFDRRLLSILEGHDLIRPFAAVIISSEVGAYKPHARMFATAQQRMSATPMSSLHIGDDTQNDVVGAQNAGWHAAQVQRPQTTLLTIAEKVFSGAYSGLMRR
jgi:putative hydrolase of the HAD superfamily